MSHHHIKIKRKSEYRAVGTAVEVIELLWLSPNPLLLRGIGKHFNLTAFPGAQTLLLNEE